MTTKKRCEIELISVQNNEKEVQNQMEESIMVKKCTCEKCGHSWIPRSELIPETCANPKCRSPYWNRQRAIIPYSEEQNAKQ